MIKENFSLEISKNESIEILKKNDRGGYTVPSEKLYPYQWNWDSAICSLGWNYIDENRAWKEIQMLLKGQWNNGMIPHIIFHQNNPNYYPNANVWMVPESFFPKGVNHPKTSGITQPPILATCLRKIWESNNKVKKMKMKFLIFVKKF